MSEFTVGKLRRHLKGLDDDVKISFSGGLTFYRLKHWDDNEFVVEFDEPVAYLSESFKREIQMLKSHLYVSVNSMNQTLLKWSVLMFVKITSIRHLR